MGQTLPTHSLKSLCAMMQVNGPEGLIEFSLAHQFSNIADVITELAHQRTSRDIHEKTPERTYRTKVIQSWDTAAKDGAQNDWSVCTTWLLDDGRFYLLDLTRGRYEYPRLRTMALTLAEAFKPHTILIEDASTGIALAQELREAGTYTVGDTPRLCRGRPDVKKPLQRGFFAASRPTTSYRG